MSEIHRLIALDTATESASTALWLDGATSVQAEPERNRHSERLIPLLDTLLEQAGMRVHDADVIAFGAGPGAFTGLRVACGVAQGLAWACDKPIVAVSNLAATASRAASLGVTGRVLTALDARMGECYVGVYDLDGQEVRCVSDAELIQPASLQDMIAAWSPDCVVGSAVQAYRLGELLPAALLFDRPVLADAGDIARVGVRMAQLGQTTTAALAAPVYVRNRVALTIEQRARGERL